MFLENVTWSDGNLTQNANYSAKPQTILQPYDIVMYIIWSFIGAIIGLQVTAIISIIIWATLDFAKNMSQQIKKLCKLYRHISKQPNKPLIVTDRDPSKFHSTITLISAEKG